MPVLEAVSITKAFGGIQALSSVSLRVDAGEALGLVGPNGAGKTTLFDCLSGVVEPDEGSVLLRGIDVSRASVQARARMGLARTFQRVELFPGTTPRDHLLLAERIRGARGSLWRDLLNLGAPSDGERRRAEDLLILLGLRDLADTPVEALSLGQRRLVELGRALATDPKIILLDEPSSGLDRSEAAALGRVLDDVRRGQGTALLLVEHDMDLVIQVVERLVVLDYGVVIAHGAPNEVLTDPAVRTAYTGVAP